ncbi:hypothetical protein K491DRAFT_685479 [Lophiostoma macrostomum CBS 122681]|uniref:Zn(2)-C6 fungal-type domain-containing protein n=1 Tax=Lophiostoma macrostomum CBS 122681 TaxID=1314788 RepID=A0A6A6SLH5_9PLEO|nr:hypothetical protein K491DRAFT_685479 [Lophiostoma macrostomum CBS 122681]
MPNPTRSRARKACVRCKALKVKCGSDAVAPCPKCQFANATCLYESASRVASKRLRVSYLAKLKRRNSELNAAVQWFFDRLEQGNSWLGARLEKTANGKPNVDDILKEVSGMLQQAKGPKGNVGHMHEVVLEPTSQSNLGVAPMYFNNKATQDIFSGRFSFFDPETWKETLGTLESMYCSFSK